MTENYRLIRTNLQHTKQQGTSAVLVTSALQGEGKTTTAANLALASALSGQRVLLVDADLRRPTAHTVLGMPRTPGLAEILSKISRPNGQESRTEEKMSLAHTKLDSSYIHRTLVDGLYFVPAGTTEERPAEALGSEYMHRFIEVVEQHFDLVVIDTPPTRVSSDAVVIGAQTRARALIVSAEAADGRGLDAVVRSLHAVDAPIAGVVFNRFDEQKSQYGGLYEYSYYTSEEYNEYQNALQKG